MQENKNVEVRSYNFEIRTEESDEGRGILEGRPIVYNSETDLGFFREKIEAGALEKTDLKDVRFLINHNTDMVPLARSRNNNKNSTMQLIPDSEGLKIRVSLDIENNTEAKNLYSAVKRGDIDGMSFMFQIDRSGESWEELNTKSPLRKITSIRKVPEVSAVTFPAYSETDINARCADVLDSARTTLDSVTDSLDSDRRSLEVEKLKCKYLMGVNL